MADDERSVTKSEIAQTELAEVDDGMQADEFRKRERKVLIKLDMYIAPLLGFFNFISYIDRSNIGFAATQGMSADLGLKGSDLNVAVSIFYVLYTACEIPVSYYAKRLQFQRVMPTLTILFGAITLGGGFIHNYAGLVGTRVILGLFEGALFPCLALFIANYYKREELAVRMVFLFGSTALSGAFGGLVSYGIYYMNGARGIAGWRWIYIVEGAITIVFGIACYWLVPVSPEKAYFLSEEDKKVMRIRAEHTAAYSGGSGHFKLGDLVTAAKDIKTWLHGCQQFCNLAPLYGFNNFLPIILKSGLGYSTLSTQYLTIPVQLWGCFVYIVVAWFSDRYKSRYVPLAVFAPVVAVGYAILLSPVKPAVEYFACFVVITGMYILAGNTIAWTSANCAPDGKRAGTIGIFLTICDTSGIVVGQLYQAKDAPRYTLGHAWTLGMMVVSFILLHIILFLYKKREKEKLTMAEDEYPDGEWSDRAKNFHYVF
ncbi:high-affinity nicotinic acid transporter [Niveomyces insectorum RCEF 264]|uniref:High-affinity nicotinic acid transporter n=1 Tax=Niveomyces insectorum RCEF 264 TaxID=1081102 RepID=A0A167XTS2_9HYPO|nr:high-affinity nicotinic acid transporter [Niveomyces insectorum RCEF 264]